MNRLPARSGGVVPFTFALLLLPGCAGRAPAPDPVAGTPLWSHEPAVYIPGWNRALIGGGFRYHSPHPEVGTSQLTRATAEPMPIAWETAPVPIDFDAPEAIFIWMGGFNRGSPNHDFVFSIDGRETFTVSTIPDGTGEQWEVRGAGGCRLGFRSVLTDRYDDLMGYLYLAVPRRLLAPGEPVRIDVIGERAGSNDWYMTFEHPVTEGVTLIAEPALVRSPDGPRQLIRIDVEHLGPPATAEVVFNETVIGTLALELGYNALTTSLPAVDEPATAELHVRIPGREPLRQDVGLAPVKDYTVYLLHHSHVDIGYTHVQDEVARLQAEHLENAIAWAEASRDNPPGSVLKWNTEVLWAVDEYLRGATPEQRERFGDAVRRGWIGLDALYGNVLTGLCRPEELLQLFGFARRLRAEYGVALNAAMITDIPGWTWALVPALARNGVRYFSIGPNTGHRIGSILSELGDRPFWWESPSGTERVLVWVAGRGYSWFHTGLGATAITNRLTPAALLAYLRELEAAHWPYEMASFRYTIGSDNGPPEEGLAGYVREWNERFLTPQITIATTAEMMREFERRYGEALPVRRGDITGYWEDGAASSAAETALNRHSADRLVTAGALQAMLAPGFDLSEEFAEAWRQVLLYSEHTWGSWNSISEPDAPFTRQQWETKQAFALRADSLARNLEERIITAGARRTATGAVSGGATTGETVSAEVIPDADVPAEVIPDADVPAVDVLNPCSWPRGGVLRLEREVIGDRKRVTDGAGTALPAQILTDGSLAVFVPDIPPFGARRLFLGLGQAGSGGAVRVRGAVLENDRLRAEIDPVSGAVRSLRRTGSGIEYVDSSRYPGLNAYCYVAGRDPAEPLPAGDVTITVGEEGPLLASLVITSPAPGLRSLRREVRLAHGADHVEIIDTVNKERVLEPEGVHLAFPFLVPGADVRLDLGWGHYRPGPDSLPAANRNFFTVQYWADVSNDERGVTLAPLDAPLIELGGITMDALAVGWLKATEPSATLFSYLMNNYWETNFRASQEGPVTFRYGVRPHDGFDPAAASRFGRGLSRPLVVRPADPSAPIPGLDFHCEPEGIIATIVPPENGNGSFRVRLYNPTETALSVRVRLGDEILGPVDIPGMDFATLPFRPGSSRH